ncbi:MAG: hypothetical protein ABSE62_06075 [Chthoniobacteraceae bacterium]|jgi:hypothetical protein
MSTPIEYALLKTFRSLFEGKQYSHRDSSLGDLVASQLYEDLVSLGKSKLLTERVHRHEIVVNARNLAVGKKTRRGDGTFGELVPSVLAVTEHGLLVARGPVANIQIGAETKILAKAMIKQIDRVIGDLKRQVAEFKRTGGNPITVGFVGINHASAYTSYEGDRPFPTGGSKYKHPITEAPEAEIRLVRDAASEFDEFQLLKFKATNIEPYPFDWVDVEKTRMEYSAMLIRVSREYDKRFS